MPRESYFRDQPLQKNVKYIIDEYTFFKMNIIDTRKIHNMMEYFESYIELFKNVMFIIFYINAHLKDFKNSPYPDRHRLTPDEADRIEIIREYLVKNILTPLVNVKKIKMFKSGSEYISIHDTDDKLKLHYQLLEPLWSSATSLAANIKEIDLNEPPKYFSEIMKYHNDNGNYSIMSMDNLIPMEIYSNIAILNKLLLLDEKKQYKQFKPKIQRYLLTPTGSMLLADLDMLEEAIPQIIQNYDRIVIIQKYGFGSDGYEAFNRIPRVISQFLHSI